MKSIDVDVDTDCFTYLRCTQSYMCYDSNTISSLVYLYIHEIQFQPEMHLHTSKTITPEKNVNKQLQFV